MSNNYEGLIDLFKCSLNIRKKHLSSDHILVAQSYRNLRLAYTSVGDYRMAFKLLKQALGLNQHASITAQLSTMMTRVHIGDLHYRTGNHIGVIEYYSTAIDTFYKCLQFVRFKRILKIRHLYP